jgi:hypothetical protein
MAQIARGQIVDVQAIHGNGSDYAPVPLIGARPAAGGTGLLLQTANHSSWTAENCCRVARCVVVNLAGRGASTVSRVSQSIGRSVRECVDVQIESKRWRL